MKLDIRKMEIVLLLFVYLYVPPVVSLSTGIIGSVFFILYILANYKRIQNSISMKAFLLVMFGNCILILYAIIAHVCVYGEINDIVAAFGRQLYILSFTLCGTIVLCDLYVKNKYSMKEMWELIIYTGLVQGVMAIAAYFVRPIQSLLCVLLKNIMAVEVIERYRNIRIYGLSCGLTYSMPIVQTIIGGIALIYAKKYNKKFLFFVPILWGSAIINARIALVVAMIVVFALFMYWLSVHHNFIIKKSVLILWIVGVIIGFIACVFILIKDIDMGRIVDPIVEILALLQGKKISTTEGYISYFWNNSKAFVMPTGANLLWGGGVWNNVSDVGYIYMLWQGGLIYSGLVYIFFFILLRKWYERLKKQSAIDKIIPIMCGITLYVVNIKGQIFSGINEYINLCYLLVGMSIFIKENRNTRKVSCIE